MTSPDAQILNTAGDLEKNSCHKYKNLISYTYRNASGVLGIPVFNIISDKNETFR